jgi:hypothetical protein
MKSGALVRVNTRQSWLERLLGARGARLLLASGGTFAVVMSVPTAMIEQIATTTGLSDMSRLFVPPIGTGTRVALAAWLALVPAAIVWAVWGSPPVRKPDAPAGETDAWDEVPEAALNPVSAREPIPDSQDDFEEDDEMNLAHKASTGSPLGMLIRLVRGGFHDNDEARATLSRRRRDLHPDAPPRAPLFASRDLPHYEPQPESGAETLVPDETVAAPVSFAQAVAFARPEPEAAAVAAPPRSPEPMSEEEIARVIATMPLRNPEPISEDDVAPPIATVPQRVTEPQAVPHAPGFAAAPVFTPAPMSAGITESDRAALERDIDLPLLDGDLATLAARFEGGLAKREAIAHSEEARQSLSTRIAFAQPDASVRAALRAQKPVEVVQSPLAGDIGQPASDPGLRLDEDGESSLSNALSTLRKLTEQGRR